MQYLNLFHVPIQIIQTELNVDSLIEFCYEMKRKNEKGTEKSNVGGWQSDNIINETHNNTEFIKLKTEIEDAVKSYHEKLQFKKTLKQTVDNIWVNINQKGHSNGWHAHPGASLSGAFYLTKGKSPIVFQHPFQGITWYYWHDSFIEEWNRGNSGESRIEPEPNMLLVFPSWIQHQVSINKEDIDRISLSFNTHFEERTIEKVHEREKR